MFAALMAASFVGCSTQGSPDGRLDCDGRSSRFEVIADQTGRPATPPLDLARSMLEGLQDGDEVILGPAKGAGTSPILVVRDGKEVAIIAFVSDGETWKLDSRKACDDVEVNVAPDHEGIRHAETDAYEGVGSARR